MKQLIKIAFLIIVIGLGAGYYFRADISSWYRLTSPQLEKAVDQLKTIEREIIAPPPLRGPIEEVKSSLTVDGTVAQTNFWRQQNGLLALSTNAQLTIVAQTKADDMFNRQYFEHESPTGQGPGDLASAAGYEYLIVGENLALGNYENDQALVKAWMNSPGHRENILNSQYTEIGVAVKRGTYEGRTVWLAVQEFGRPAPDCSSPSASFNAQIKEKESLLGELKEQLLAKRREIDSTRPRRGPEYSQKVDEYTEFVRQYNALIGEMEALISVYNSQVNAYNACIQ